MNQWHKGILLSNTIKNPKNDIHCLDLTMRSGKMTVDPPMSIVIENNVEFMMTDDEKIVELKN